MHFLDLSAYLGLAAVGLATINLGLGLLIAARYSPRQNWPHRRINLFQFHDRTGWALLGCSCLHPLLLLWVKRSRFGWQDLVYPVHSPGQPLYNTIGALALAGLLFVIVTSYLRRQLGRRLWKGLHYTAYAALIGLFAHGLLTNPELKSAPLQLLDGGKLWVEACLLAAFTILVLGMKRRRQRRRYKSTLVKTPAEAVREK